jgi:hypothetical protein
MPTTALPSGSSMTGHPLAFSVMRICGVDPVAAVDRTAAWPEGYAPDYVDNDDGVLRMRVPLDAARDVLLTVDGAEARVSARGQAFPDTLALGVRGQPIGALVDHVLLTGSGARVAEASAFDPLEEGVGTHFLLDGAPVEFVAP